MPPSIPAKILRIYISESDRFGNQPLYEAIVAKCREMKIAGATVLRGHEGYGETGELHKGGLLKADRPIAIMIVDEAENIERIASAVEPMMDTGMMAQSDVKIIRVQKQTTSAA